MAKLVELEALSIAKLGIPVPVTIKYNLDVFEKDVTVIWAGIRLYLNRPCKKNILVSRTEIFSNGMFENGKYIRTKNLQMSRRMVPTIEKNDVLYQVHGNLTFLSERGEEDNFEDEKLIIFPTFSKWKKINPIKMELQGITIDIPKDTFKDEDEIPINYTLDNFKNLEINLIQSSKLNCRCEEAETCVHIKPEVVDKKNIISSNVIKDPLSTGKLTIKLPKAMSPSQDWAWDDVTRSKMLHVLKYTNNYYLEVIATNNNDEIIKFQTPVTIIKEQEEMELFSPGSKEVIKKILTPESISADKKVEGNKTIIHLKNLTKSTMEGVSIKLTGIKELFFELPPVMIGKKTWNPNEEIKISGNETAPNIEYQVLIEDNTGIEITKKIN